MDIGLHREGAIMERSRRLLPLAGILFTLGAVGLSRFSANVRSVDVVGLAGAGFALGVGFAFLVQGFTGRSKP
jgi:hypothetical protein